MKQGGRKERQILCFVFWDERGAGGTMWIMEARKPDRLASSLASLLPRFISYCHVAAWLGLFVSVCTSVCPCAMWVSVVIGFRPEKMVEAIQASQSYIHCINVIATGHRIVCCMGLACRPIGHTPTPNTASSGTPSALFFFSLSSSALV